MLHIILLSILILGIIISIGVIIYKRKTIEKEFYLNINDLNIIYRDKEKQNLISDLLKNKKNYFTKDEIKTLENKFQFFDIDKNITSQVLKIKPDENPVGVGENNIEIIQTVNTNPAYNVILNKFNENKPLDYSDVEFLKNTDLNNYYYDIFGNRIIASLDDYMADYLTNIDETDPKVCKPVQIQKQPSGMIIPDMYPIWKYSTNAYNIDWSRIQNPATIY